MKLHLRIYIMSILGVILFFHNREGLYLGITIALFIYNILELYHFNNAYRTMLQSYKALHNSMWATFTSYVSFGWGIFIGYNLYIYIITTVW